MITITRILPTKVMVPSYQYQEFDGRTNHSDPDSRRAK